MFAQSTGGRRKRGGRPASRPTDHHESNPDSQRSNTAPRIRIRAAIHGVAAAAEAAPTPRLYGCSSPRFCDPSGDILLELFVTRSRAARSRSTPHGGLRADHDGAANIAYIVKKPVVGGRTRPKRAALSRADGRRCQLTQYSASAPRSGWYAPIVSMDIEPSRGPVQMGGRARRASR